MKTEVVMLRPLFGEQVSQKSKTKLMSATDIVRAGNKLRQEEGKGPFNLSAWLNNESTKVFIQELSNKYGKVLSLGRGKGHHTWVHPLLAIDIALSISPKLKVEVYEWLYDNLLKYRNKSGDTYKAMCGALWVRHKNPRTFQDNIQKLADIIQHKCNVVNWQTATADQLDLRNHIHKTITSFVDVMNNNKEAIRLALKAVDKDIARQQRGK